MSSSLNIGSSTVGLSSILKEGIKSYKGLDQATLRNIHACLELGDLLRTSFGPCGRNKLLLNQLDKVSVTSDAQTIMQEAGVVHPGAKLLVQVAQQQTAEVGDGAALVVILSAALLGKASELIQLGVRPGVIRDGFHAGILKALELLDELVTEDVAPDWKSADAKTLTKQLLPLMRPVMASKQLGLEDWLAQVAADALAHAIPCDAPERFDLDNVRIVKIMGGSYLHSQVIHGLVLNHKLNGAPLKHGAVKVAVYSCPLDIGRTETKGTVLLKSAAQMIAFGQDEERSLEADLKAIADSGAQLLVTSDTVSDLALHFMSRLGLAALKLTSKFDLRRVVRSTGARALTSLRAPKPEELGTASQVQSVEIGSDYCTLLKNDQGARISTIVLRGASTNVMEDYERSILNGISVVKAVLMAGDGRLIPGAGATEMELSRRLAEFALSSGLSGLPLMALQYFAEAFTSVPLVLAENAGLDPIPYMAALEAAHNDKRTLAGVHPDEEQPVDTHVRDVLIVKRKAIGYAGRIAALVLGVDQIIMAKQANPGGPQARANQPADAY
jgi:T-complex protein 1 subunit theta